MSESQRKEVQPQEIYKSCYNMLPYRDKYASASGENTGTELISRIEDLVRGLLMREQKDRLGYLNVNEIREHPFYASINWATLSYTQTSWKPDTHEKFTQNYDARRKVAMIRGRKKVQVDPLELFYGKNYNYAYRKRSGSRDFRKGSTRTQVNRRLSEGKMKFAHVQGLREKWVRNGRPISRTRNYVESERNTTMPQIEERVSWESSSMSESRSYESIARVPSSKTNTLTDTIDFSEISESNISVSAVSQSEK